MPVSKKRPKHALVIRDYAKLEEFAAKFAEGYFNLLILIGDAGIAKSQTIRRALSDDSLWVEGSASAFGIYQALYEHRGQPVVLDDVDSLYSDRDCVRLLKCLCQTDPVKTVSWYTGAVGRNKEIPQQFETSSKVIIVANEWKTLSENVRAVENRGHLLFFEPSPVDVHLESRRVVLGSGGLRLHGPKPPSLARALDAALRSSCGAEGRRHGLARHPASRRLRREDGALREDQKRREIPHRSAADRRLQTARRRRSFDLLQSRQKADREKTGRCSPGEAHRQEAGGASPRPAPHCRRVVRRSPRQFRAAKAFFA